MKKIFLYILIMFCTNTFVCAENFPDIKYKNIKVKDKITYDSETNVWSKAGKNNKNYFVKTNGFGDFYDYLDPEQNFVFSTQCEYEFIYNKTLIGYSNKDMKFYEILFDNDTVAKRDLSKEEVEEILPDYTVISISDFSTNTNSLKIKKGDKVLKIFLYNDTFNEYEMYNFRSGNTKFEQYDLRGFIKVYKPGMIQFSKSDDSEDKNWYVILVR